MGNDVRNGEIRISATIKLFFPLGDANSLRTAEIYPCAVAQRKQLIADGTLIDKTGFLVFTRDAEFSSPSTVAVIHGRSANGLTAWKTEDGKLMGQIRQADLDGAAGKKGAFVAWDDLKAEGDIQ
jgi:hypothetical protein